ncbi:MAG: glycosyltransferase family 4 protein [Vulcanimicrobiota bacterium]
MPHRYEIEFVVLSFEGPDQYSLIGGLGVRVTELTRTMCEMGYSTRLFFVGDPDEPDYQVENGKLHYHRWSRWLSRRYPNGVYHGEVAKVEDYEKSLPQFLVSQIIAKNAAAGVLTVVLGEDWHTASAMSRIADLLKEQGLTNQALLFWNANNVFGFDAIDFPRLSSTTQLLTISRYMKERMRSLKLQTQVVGNGIPPRFWNRIDKALGNELRRIFPGALLTKVGRYHTDKRWLMAVESMKHLREMGGEPKLIVRGGREEHGEKVRERAGQLGLKWARINPPDSEDQTLLRVLEEHKEADILELDFFVPEKLLRTLYWASSAVLANSEHEPFGLVGLEVMACGGLAVTGSTGEEYLHHFHNGIALSSNDPREIALYVQELQQNPEKADELRRSGRKTAKRYGWPTVVEDFIRKIELASWAKGLTLQKT